MPKARPRAMPGLLRIDVGRPDSRTTTGDRHHPDRAVGIEHERHTSDLRGNLLEHVFNVVNDPVGQGFVATLSHPGGNITGFTFIDFPLIGKWLEALVVTVSSLDISLEPRHARAFFYVGGKGGASS